MFSGMLYGPHMRMNTNVLCLHAPAESASCSKASLAVLSAVASSQGEAAQQIRAMPSSAVPQTGRTGHQGEAMQDTQNEYWRCRSLHRACPDSEAVASFTSLGGIAVCGS